MRCQCPTLLFQLNIDVCSDICANKTLHIQLLLHTIKVTALGEWVSAIVICWSDLFTKEVLKWFHLTAQKNWCDGCADIVSFFPSLVTASNYIVFHIGRSVVQTLFFFIWNWWRKWKWSTVKCDEHLMNALAAVWHVVVMFILNDTVE